MGRSALCPLTNLNHFYPVAERGVSRANPARRDWSRSSRNSQHGIRLQKTLYNKKQGAKIPLLKVLEILKNFFQEVFKQGLGQSPKVLFLLHQQTGVNGQREYRVARLAKENAVVRVVEKVNLVNRLLPEIERDRPLRRGIVLIVVRQKR